MHAPVYLDNHATTRVDPRVVDAMLPFFSDTFGNPGSTNHAFGWAGNLNVSFANVDGESLLMSTKDVAASSGSACASSKPEPSHVLRALGLSEEVARSSIRFGLGRFNTPDDIEYAIGAIADSVTRLRKMSSLPVLPPEVGKGPS